MSRLAADENISTAIVNALKRELPGLDIVRVVDAGLMAAGDPEILEWAAKEKRVLLSYDATTMIRFAYARIEVGQYMPGLIVIKSGVGYGRIIEDILIVLEASTGEELEYQVIHVPL